ncbi:MAG: CPBP family intramembrane metalloprotease [Rhodobacteraceae bacterium]|nr:CPBP family intramembrane metalloprotease [Paracoccaceae bacterium]
MFPHFSPAFQAFVAPAQARSEIWRTILGLVLVFAIFLLTTLLLGLGTAFLGEYIEPGLGQSLMHEVEEGRTIFATFAMLFLIATMIPALWLILKFLHKRPLHTLLGPTGTVNWRLWRGAAAIILILAAIDATTTVLTTELLQQMPLIKWLTWLAPALILLFLQTTAEEMVFRGYLQQQLAARFKSRWAWWVLPSVIFGLAHYNPTLFGGNAWIIVAVTTLMGMILADVTARFGSLSAAMGLHFANNLVVMLFLNSPGQLSGMSFYLYSVDMQSAQMKTAMLISLAAMLVGYGIFMLIMRRRRL